MYKVAIFDMDGTILDTIEDLKDSLNHALAENGHRSDYTAVHMSRFFGSGVRVAVERALATEEGASEYTVNAIGEGGVYAGDKTEVDRIISEFEAWYPEHCDINTKSFTGTAEMMKIVQDAGIRTAVVSNKLHEAAVILADRYFPDEFEFVQGVDESVRRKPNPDATLKIIEYMGISKDEAVYIGDTEIDIETARNAGIDCISVDWGFRSKAYLEKIGAASICSSMNELADELVGGR